MFFLFFFLKKNTREPAFSLLNYCTIFFYTGGVSFAVWEEKTNNVDHNEAVSERHEWLTCEKFPPPSPYGSGKDLKTILF